MMFFMCPNSNGFMIHCQLNLKFLPDSLLFVLHQNHLLLGPGGFFHSRMMLKWNTSFNDYHKQLINLPGRMLKPFLLHFQITSLLKGEAVLQPSRHFQLETVDILEKIMLGNGIYIYLYKNIFILCTFVYFRVYEVKPHIRDYI